MGDRSNGIMSKRDLSSAKKKKQTTYGSEDEEDSSYGVRITEERYRAMLGEHKLIYPPCSHQQWWKSKI